MAGPRGVVGVKRPWGVADIGVGGAAGSELSSIDRSVARRVSGLTDAAPGLCSEEEGVADVGVVRMDMLEPGVEDRGWEAWWGALCDLAEPMSMCMLLRAEEGRAREEVMGELRTASRTGSKAGMASPCYVFSLFAPPRFELARDWTRAMTTLQERCLELSSPFLTARSL